MPATGSRHDGVVQGALRAGGLRLLLVLSCAAAGCSSYSGHMGPVLQALVREDYSTALSQLDKKPQRESALWQAERGLLLRYAGRLEESNEAFAAARSRQEDLYTRSLSNEALSLAANDAVRPYRLRDYEVPFLYLYSILNYLELGDQEGALVEARALSEALELRLAREDEIPGDPEGEAAADWGPGRLLAGLVFESGGEWNDAWVAYRAARAAYGFPQSPTALKNPESLVSGPDPRLTDPLSTLIEEGVARSALQLGLSREESGACDSAWIRVSRTEENGPPARLVLWVEDGLVPALEETHLQVPILKEERDWGEDRIEQWSRSVGNRVLDVSERRWNSGDLEVAYFLDVALPVLPSPAVSVPFAYTAHLRTLSQRNPADSARSTLGTPLAEADPILPEWLASVIPAEDVGELARRDLNHRYPGIAVRAAARALLKALAARAVEKRSGEVAGRLTNLLGVATERADTRGWSSLPRRIGVAVLGVPAAGHAGSFAGAVQVDGPGPGAPLGAAGSFELTSGGWHFFSCRLFP